MNDIRAKFEEIWPVPAGVCWWIEAGEYNAWSHEDGHMADEMNARLDTFTRCQETTSIHLSLIDEMAMEIEGLSIAAYGCVIQQSQDIVDRAKQLLGAKE